MIKKIIRCLPLVVLLFANACTAVYTARGAYYRVRPGDTLEKIAQRCRVDVQDLAEMNNIEHSRELKAGSSVYISGMTPSGFAAILKKEGIVIGRSRRETKQASLIPSGTSESPVKIDRDRFRWPIQGEISSLYGIRHGRRHDGIDIRAKAGTPVGVAEDGEVVFSKRMKGYGNLILVRHKEDFFTVYAHNSVNLVKVGSKVKKGQVIAKVGRTGRTTGPHLHFEVREGAKARNPLFFLPQTAFAKKARDKGGTNDAGGPD